MSPDLPTLTDEQIDAAVERAFQKEAGCNRGSNAWAGLRKAFPAPKPPKPEFAFDSEFTNNANMHVAIFDGPTDRKPYEIVCDGSWMDARAAREMAAALVECADWVEANR